MPWGEVLGGQEKGMSAYLLKEISKYNIEDHLMKTRYLQLFKATEQTRWWIPSLQEKGRAIKNHLTD